MYLGKMGQFSRHLGAILDQKSERRNLSGGA